MAFMPKGSSTLEKSARSVFVGNISYDVTEEQIKQVFSKAGQIVHFRLVHDRDTGRPKGFGFCEFNDPSTAAAAIRIFNGHELNGRPLRVDSAASSERNMEEAQQLQAAAQAIREPAPRPVEENPYGKEPEPGKAPDAIAKVVSAMPPEQMFELMKQMKQNVISNPSHTRRLLMENPQLAYALLQAQVVMRVVDPKVAYSMLHREVPATQQPFHQLPVSSTNGSAMPPPQQYRPQGPPPASSSVHGGHFQAGPPPSFGGPRYGGGPVMPMQPAVSMNSPSSSAMQTSPSVNSADEEKNQAEMLLKVINLTDEQINLLPPDDRAKVLELRNQLRHRIASDKNPAKNILQFVWIPQAKRDERLQAGGPEVMDTQPTARDTCGDHTVDDIQKATQDIQKQKRKRRRRIHKDANLIRLNLRKRLKLDDKTRYVDIIGKQSALGELEQDVVDNGFSQALAETIIDIEQDEFQSRARFTHLGYLDYYSISEKNADYHKNPLQMYRNCDIMAPQKEKKNGAESEKPSPANNQ